MTVTLEGLDARLARIERAVGTGVVEQVRSLSISQVEALTGIPRKAILAAIRSGDLPAIPIGERTRVVRPADMDAWLAWRETRA